jgi:hypothetical protein
MSNEPIAHTELTASLHYSPPRLIETTFTTTTLDMKLSDGRIISYPRNFIDIGSLTSSCKDLGNGKYLYAYTFDNRQAEMIRVGEFDHQFGRPIMSGPAGWYGSFVAWDAKSEPVWNETVTRSEAAKYLILSEFLPGPLPLHIDGAETIRKDFVLPFSGAKLWERDLMQQIWLQIRLYGNSVEPLVIGPVFKPGPSEQEVRVGIHRWVEGYNLELFRPFDHPGVNLMETESAVVPTTAFEGQVLDCLKVAIRAMIPYNPAAPQIEKARAGRKARKRLSTRGITSLEQAQTRLRSFRAAQSILNIVKWKTSVARAPEHTSYVQMEEEQDARLEAITKSKTFAVKWKAKAERLSVDEPYYAKLIGGIDAALRRLKNRIDFLHTAYDLTISAAFCKSELARACAANLAKIEAESVVGIHLTNEEAKASLSAENWQFIDKASYGPSIRRRFNCQAGRHELRADVWTDLVDEKISSISLQLAVQLVVRYQDGSEHPKMFDSNTLLTVLGA